MLPATTGPFLALQDALRGRYSLERELGRGGMGIVYLAHEVALDRPVAFKLLPPALAAKPNRRERFLREARTAARLSHPNIVPIFAVDQVGDFVFFTMAYVDGETLGHRVRSRGPLPTAEATRLLRDVAGAVGYAHAQGVIHRDLKAENILLERGSGRALVTDFGIAHVRTQPEITGEHQVLGTVAYMSPEQAKGDSVDERSDVYSLGVVGYFAASARLPFEGTTATEILDQHIHRPAPPLATVGLGIDDALAQAVDCCLAKSPSQRFQTAGELASALDESLEVRRELPVPLRAFLGRLRHTSQSNAGLTLLGVWALAGLAMALVRGQWGVAGLAAGFLAVVVASPVGFLLPMARRVLGAGYAREDIVDALSTDLDRQREELAFQFGPQAGSAGGIARRAAYAGLGLFSFGAALGVTGTMGADLAVGTMALGAVTTVIAGLIAAHRYQRRRDLVGERWLRFWRSRLGEWAARLAGFGLKRLPASAAATFENLPMAAREALEDLPSVLHRLELQTQGVRTWIAELDRTGSAQAVEAREAAQQHLAESTAALEAIRLQLDRLHDGTATLEDIRAELSAARRIGESVDRLLEARREIQQALDQRSVVSKG